MSQATDLFHELSALVIDQAKAEGLDLKASAVEIAQYTASRATVLSDSVGHPGYADAFKREGLALMLEVGLAAANAGDATDTRSWAMLQAALAVGAKAMRLLA